MSIITNIEFKLWVTELKLRIRLSQLKAAIQVNEALLQLYWSLGFDIIERQMDAIWGRLQIATKLVTIYKQVLNYQFRRTS